jgi:hypothetical protein
MCRVRELSVYVCTERDLQLIVYPLQIIMTDHNGIMLP